MSSSHRLHPLTSFPVSELNLLLLTRLRRRTPHHPDPPCTYQPPTHHQLLGRADNLKDFIRRGCDRAWTEVTLSGGEGGRDVTIKRDISIRRLPDGSRSYSSEWYINGGHKSEKDVKALVADMNIQFDNLCQFLPQDKVVEFARMGPTELLEATEKAIGDGRMYEMHQELIRKRVAVKEAAMSRGVVAQSLERLRDEHEKQRRDWERFRCASASACTASMGRGEETQHAGTVGRPGLSLCLL